MKINNKKREISLSWHELINKIRFNPPKKIELMVSDLPKEQRYCTWDEKNLVYRQDYNNSILYIPLGLDIYIESVIVIDEFDPLKTIYEIGG